MRTQLASKGLFGLLRIDDAKLPRSYLLVEL